MSLSASKRGTGGKSSAPSSSRKRGYSKLTSPESKDEKKTKNGPKAAEDVPVSVPTGLAKSFGIEIEFNLAFHEEVLSKTLQKYRIEAEIVKEFKEADHLSMLARYKPREPHVSYKCRFRYPMWALHVPEQDASSKDDEEGLTKCMGFSHTTPTTGRTIVRRYILEPLLITKDCFENNNLHCNVIGWVQPGSTNTITFPNAGPDIMVRQDTVDYTKWTLTNDHTLIGALGSQLLSHLSTKGLASSTSDLKSWDNYGLELISPRFELENKEAAFAELQNYLQALETKQTSGLGSVWASIHVHIGFDFEKPEHMPILTLQHLAYILLLHESLITKCFPKSRSGYYDANATPAELFPLQDLPDTAEEDNEREVLQFEAQYTGVDNVESNFSHTKNKVGLENLPARLFLQGDDVEDLIVQLVFLLQWETDENGHRQPFRGFIYNFANLFALATQKTSWKTKRPTVEFRQHDATLDVEVIKHWVVFLEAIIRTAEAKSLQSTVYGALTPLDLSKPFHVRQTDKYPPNNTDSTKFPYEDIKEFCVEFLGLAEEEGDYWAGRHEQHGGN